MALGSGGTVGVAVVVCALCTASKSAHRYYESEFEKKEIDKKLAAQTELLAETEKVNKILDNMLEGVVTIDSAGVIQAFNQAAEKIFSYQLSQRCLARI